MPTPSPLRLRLGAVALATSVLLFAAFPLVRPFFTLDVFSPTLAAVASGPLASPPWVVAHLGLTLAFALLPVGLLAVYATIADSPSEPRAFRGTLLGVLGIALVLPTVGVETYTMPVIGRLYLEGAEAIGPALARIYRGPATLVMLVGLLLLGVGVVLLARAVSRSGRLPRGAAIALATGLALWLPLLPRAVRVVDGLMIGLGGVWLAWGIWRETLDRAAGGASAPSAARVLERVGSIAGR